MKNIILTRLSLVLVLIAWLAGCATTGMTHAERTDAYNQFIISEKLEELKSITAFRFDGWGSLGQEHLIISTSFNKPYLIKLRSRCFDLKTAMVIGIDNTGSSLQAGFDAIIVPKTSKQKCYIKSIYKLTKEQQKAILKIGRKDKDEKEDK